MGEIKTLRKQIILGGGVLLLLFAGVSLAVLGIRLSFMAGLLAGFAVAMVNFHIMAFSLNRMLESGNRGMSSGGFFARMILYCVAFYACIKVDYPAGAGCLLGILSTKVPMFYLYVVRHKLDVNRKVSPEVQAMYAAEDKEKEEEDW